MSGGPLDPRTRLLAGRPVEERRLALAGTRSLVLEAGSGAPLWGRHDRMLPLRVGEDASARLGWPPHVVEEVGHVPHVDRPDAFLGALSDAFLPTAG